MLRMLRSESVGRRRNRQELSHLGDVVCAGGVGEEAVMPDAMQAIWQDVPPKGSLA